MQSLQKIFSVSLLCSFFLDSMDIKSNTIILNKSLITLNSMKTKFFFLNFVSSDNIHYFYLRLIHFVSIILMVLAFLISNKIPSGINNE